jgi:hypothetical protein
VIYGSLSLKQGQVIACQAHRHKAQNTIQFLDLVKEFKQKYYPGVKRSILLLWDGAGCHRGEEIRQWLKDNPIIFPL